MKTVEEIIAYLENEHLKNLKKYHSIMDDNGNSIEKITYLINVAVIEKILEDIQK